MDLIFQGRSMSAFQAQQRDVVERFEDSIGEPVLAHTARFLLAVEFGRD
jgi:hypothetical protein